MLRLYFIRWFVKSVLFLGCDSQYIALVYAYMPVWFITNDRLTYERTKRILIRCNLLESEQFQPFFLSVWNTNTIARPLRAKFCPNCAIRDTSLTFDRVVDQT